jgi:hypothetical protein
VPPLAFDLLDFIPVQLDRDFQCPKALHLLKIGVFMVGCVTSTRVNLAEASGKSVKTRTENALEEKVIGLDVNSAV